MIQRIQTLYLALAVALCTACLCLPLGTFVNDGGELTGTLYNLWVHLPSQVGDTLQVPDAPLLAREAAGSHSFTPWALFALLLLATVGMAFSIFIYRTRLVQSRLVMLCCILLVGWYAVYGCFAYLLSTRYEAAFTPEVWAAFPAVACILAYLAFRGILKDEALVRSLDRLR
ncbi:MAG: DUF4293 domain-containing protein [Bacteroidales bacterium]|nr:DUF4293 domain-containing protein [Bacteroidales bacterium]